MKTDPSPALSKDAKQERSLARVLGQSEHVRDLVEKSAEELASVNTAIKQELENQAPLPVIEDALERNQVIEDKIEDATEKLTVMNQALKDEVTERNMVDSQLATARKQEEAARYAAFHDVLTDLPNRALFNDRLEHGIAQAKRHDWSLAVMFVDLDKFKRINDTHGHQAGDVVLRTVAQRLKENTRDDDTVSRHGGDEFLYLLTEVRDTKDIAMIAEKTIKAIQVPCNIDASVFNVSASIGISIFPKDGSTADELIKSADEAMYRAKKNRSGYEFR